MTRLEQRGRRAVHPRAPASATPLQRLRMERAKVRAVPVASLAIDASVSRAPAILEQLHRAVRPRSRCSRWERSAPPAARRTGRSGPARTAYIHDPARPRRRRRGRSGTATVTLIPARAGLLRVTLLAGINRRSHPAPASARPHPPAGDGCGRARPGTRERGVPTHERRLCRDRLRRGRPRASRHPPNLEAYYVNVDSPFSVRGRGR
jgi:hypothetical protein